MQTFDPPATRPLAKVVGVVLAGGFGTRVGHLLAGIPKPMAMVAGRPFLEHVTGFLALHGIREIVLSTGFLSEVIERHFVPARVPGVQVTWVRETTPLGTAGGFLAAARAQAFRPDVWLVANGDSLVLADLAAFVRAFESVAADAAVIGLEMADASRYGTLDVSPDGNLRRFAEKSPGGGVINAGVYLFRDRLLDQFPVRRPLSFETDVFPQLIDRGARILVHPVEAPFLDIGTPETLAQAERFIEHNATLLGSRAKLPSTP